MKTQSRFWYSPDYPDRQRELDETFAYYRRVMSPGFIACTGAWRPTSCATASSTSPRSISQPTLLMWGDQDNGAGMGKGVAKLHELIPDNELHVFPGRRHSLEAECPDELAAQILAGR